MKQQASQKPLLLNYTLCHLLVVPLLGTKCVVEEKILKNG